MKNVTELKSERLTFREITYDDAGKIVEWRGDPKVYIFFTRPHKVTLEEHLHWYNNKYLCDENRIDFMALDGQMSKVGVFGLKRSLEDIKKIEISYILAPQHYHKGYAGEGVERICAFAKEYWHSEYAVAEIHKDNINSIRFIKRLGFEAVASNGDFVSFERGL